MDFQTKIEIPSSAIRISHKDKMLMMGSCFTENIGENLVKNKFDVNINPFGILYNPLSISKALEMLIDRTEFTENDIFAHQGIYSSFAFHSRYSDTDKNVFLSRINEARKAASTTLQEAKTLLVTFGTSYVYKHIEQDLVVANCHKLPASAFDRYRLPPSTIIEVWERLIQKIQSVNPHIEVLFTVSPIRHLKDGAHDNQLSKASLLLAIDHLCHSGQCHYFPSYEIVMDELRDYRFYNEDMLHPSPTAIKYIWQRFGDTFFDSETHAIMNEWTKISMAIQHRPFNQSTEAHKQFLEQTLLKTQAFERKYPYLCCKNEIACLQDRIKH